ncbi:MAG: bifunctional oligoribonuclease/PAP phosphatase NrnA [Lentisphaerae bacterium]|jgi:bifunctional oligoribonuclease and PAP phosphatase NrnA|nr:bifunctional oligoribonuclease/PAP phosphatase NrnA [Lentisphaerota bacterium]MBT4821326.1 bifunctional oligoribonuclease/PAP phosphatase NrnA [Lentisphaerota bacterium]MBT5610440.1 bifunctional oligoribonuclease/PAP phosphatase NrnA [Lentisphaerota bacterium]MBT7061031.1 bifunctional oligoribonuclease/PAP phosphatase NrnA [Lentisphaerota bacterium]MBT7842184.1 bifunctional oligoribonuclease/PAP phosphatase NrnA [Lentisphaerota bacterium]
MNAGQTAGEDVLAWLRAHPRVLLTAHERPDGDAFGTLFGLQAALAGLGREAAVYIRGSVPRKYERLLPSNAKVWQGPGQDDDSFDGVVCLDVTEEARVDLPDDTRLEQISDSICVVDHHPDNQRFGAVNWIGPDMAATAQMVAMMWRTSGQPICPPAATALLTGLVADTGGFRFQNTTPDALKTAAWLVESGADYRGIMDALFMSEPRARRVLEARLLEHAVFCFNDSLVYSVLTDELLDEIGVDKEDTEGLIDTLKVIEGVDVACLLQPGDGRVRVSMRSRRGEFPVNELAHVLGGGGHPLAAGAWIENATLSEAVETLLTTTQRMFYDG